MPIYEKHFTLEEAEALLPQLRRLHQEILVEIERLEANEGDLVKSLEVISTNGGGERLQTFFRSSGIVQQRLGEILETGVQIKDVRRGLFDFPAMRGREEILLCWLVEEPGIACWHDLEQGFAGRRPIGEL